jgi:O-antigen ligase/tetratricopeptide (TPR) repeat protein
VTLRADELAVDEKWRTAIMLLLMGALFVPLIVGYDFFFPYVVPRNVFFRVAVEAAATILVAFVCLQNKRLALRDEPIFWALAAFVAAVSLSAIFSPARAHSFFGDFERMGGVWAWLHLALFFLLLRTLGEEDWGRLLTVALGVTLLVSINAIAEHSHIVAAQRTGERIVAASSSTVGNGGLLAAYLMFGVGLGAYLAATRVRWKWIYIGAGLINLIALIFAANRSTIIGISLGALVGATVFSFISTSSRRRWIAPLVAVAIAMFVAAATALIRAFPANGFVSALPTVLLRLGGTSTGGADASRTMQWKTALQGFLDRPLVGYGVENHNLAWSAHFDPRIYALDTDVYDRTHNQFLELLATTGLIGTLAFLAVWVAIGYSLYRAYKSRRLGAPAFSILIGLQIAYATYLFFWFVDLNSTMLWILFAALIASCANPLTMVRPVGVGERERPLIPRAIVALSVGLLVVLLDWQAYQPLRAANALAQIQTERGTVSANLARFDVAVNPLVEQTAHTPIVLADYLSSLKPRFDEMRDDVEERRMLDRAFDNALEAFSTEIHRDTLNDRLYTHEAALLMDAAEFYGSDAYLGRGIAALNHAISLSPHRIQQRMLLANAFLGQRDTAQAKAVLAAAISVDPMLGEPRYRLGNLYLARGGTDSAIAMFRKSLALGYVGPPEAYLRLGKRLEFSGRASDAASLYSEYLEAKYTKAVWDPTGSIERTIPAADLAVAAHLPLLYAKAEENELAIKSAAALALFDPTQSTVVDRFVSDVGARRRRGWIARNSLLRCTSARTRTSADSVSLGACAVFRSKL